MATRAEQSTEPRVPLTRERVLRAAVELADREGVESLSMRRLGQEVGVEAMSLYHHVANKEDLLDGIVDVIVAEIDSPPSDTYWKPAMRQQILSAREVMMRHQWASAVIVTRVNPSPAMLKYMNSAIGILRKGGFSVDLTHHAMHVMGSRILGFAQELYDDSEELADSPEMVAIMLEQMAGEYPYLTEIAKQVSHDEATVVGTGCDDQFEFEFALDLILDGLERLKDRDAAAG
jgi:AcrR family transcriptional regulator